MYPIKVSSLKAKSFPNNGVIARRRPLPGNPVRYVTEASFGCGRCTVSHSSGEGNASLVAAQRPRGGGARKRRSFPFQCGDGNVTFPMDSSL